MQSWPNLIFSDTLSFEEKVQQVFEYQSENNPVYRRYCEALDNIEAIPLLPIKAFKEAAVTAHPKEDYELVFKSSGTSDMQRSIHKVHDPELYDQSLLKGFRHFYNLENAVIWGYTPGYADNPHSSLIYMIQKLINQGESGLSRFLPLDKPLQADDIKEVKQSGKQLILFGAAFGLLDLLELDVPSIPSNSVIIETGGMKTHKREISRKELHRKLSRGFGLDQSRIHSEYGMAELLSQAYATGGKWFKTVPWMQVSIRNPDNPAEVLPAYREGLIAVIDLANVHSCSFLLTHDKGVMDPEGRFQILGRWNPKDLRGCNFLIEED
ncbi:hypothetical protein LQ318_01650 [Aliifodinibius salicampi]|uniref:Acyl-protein synthetase LuxE domain-containing protein n=1 Tax=Fodinibius salicampi TaxID=1920655 RepID=A0ABT3PUS3_9BACT|nr:hypothetical protein [Fodinibius salicampi]